MASSFAFSSLRFCSKWSIYNCLEVQTIETIYFIIEISNIDSYLKILSFTILIASIVSFFSKEPWAVSWAFPTAVCLLRNRFQEHCSHGRDKINLNKQTRKRYFILSSFDVQSFSRYRKFFSIPQLLASSMLPTSVIPAITDAFSRYETFRRVFIGDTSFSFRCASSGMISVWYNLHSDLTLSQTSSDDKILSTAEKHLAIHYLKH